MFGLLLASEVLWWVLFVLLYSAGAWTYWQTLRHLPVAPVPLGVVLALPAGALGVIAAAAVVNLLTPGLAPGTYAGREGARMHLAWGVRYQLTRVLFLGPMLPFIQYSFVLRWLAWRALGGATALSSMQSSDIPLPDMPLVALGPGSVLGSRSRLSTHLMAGGKLTLGRITVGANAVVGGDCGVGPSCSIGDGSILSYGVLLAQDVTIGKNVFVGKMVRVGHDVTVGDGAIIETESEVPNGTVIPAGGRWVNPLEARTVGHLDPNLGVNMAPGGGDD